MNNWFNTFSTKASNLTGRSFVFAGAVIIIVLWALAGPVAKFSDTWQLIINTFTTLVTFLMVFIIQNTQNRNSNAQQIKLDLILRLLELDDHVIRNLENMKDVELEKVLEHVQKKGKIKR